MNQSQKQFLINWFRGWLPQEPLMRCQATPSTTRPISTTRANIQNTAITLTLIFGLLASFFVLPSSWIKEVLITIVIICGLVYVLGRRQPKIKRSVIKALVPVMIFALCFTGVEFCLFQYAGYPPTYTSDPKASLTRESMLNASVVDIVQKLEQSPAFSLLKLEYGDGIRFYQMFIDSWKGGSIRVDFISEDTKHVYQFSSNNGDQYHLWVSQSGDSFPSSHYRLTGVSMQSLQQIDTIGLDGFYDQAIAIAQNKTANLPTIDALHMNLAYNGEKGLAVQVIGYHVATSENGSMTVDEVLVSSFRPNAELQYTH